MSIPNTYRDKYFRHNFEKRGMRHCEAYLLLLILQVTGTYLSIFIKPQRYNNNVTK